MSKMITYCYVDGKGNEQIKHVSNEKDENNCGVGYSVDEYTARIWMSVKRESGGYEMETNVFPLSRIVFIRQVDS
jgi:hypothetical protein